jgi:hypothetical protein
MRRAESAGERYLHVQAGELHRAVGGYPAANARMPTCCDVMRAAMRPGDVIVHRPPKGRGASYAVRYVLPRRYGYSTEPPGTAATAGARAEAAQPASPAPAPSAVRPRQVARPINTGAPIVLVSCVKQKRTSPAPAQDLYTSALFKGMRRYAEQVGSAWYILSARHGVLEPDAVVAPYEQTLPEMTAYQREAWGQRVRQQLEQLLPPSVPVVILAGISYRRHVESALRARGHDVSVPMEGLRFGKQLQWLKARTDDR